MGLEISNKEQLDRWINERMGRDLSAIKGPPPEGATYDDGDPIVNPVNIAWQDMTTGEVFVIEYDVAP